MNLSVRDASLPSSGEKLEPRGRSNTDRLDTIDEAACCACVFHSTPQLASLQQRLLTGAHYSRLFKRSSKRSCAAASGANLSSPIWRSQIICCPIEPAELH